MIFNVSYAKMYFALQAHACICIFEIKRISLKFLEDSSDMSTFELILGIILLVCAVFLVIAVLMQHGKAKNLSGTIAGGAETFFGKTKGKAIDKMLSTATTVVAIVFVAVVIAVYAIQPDINYNANVDFGLPGAKAMKAL